MLTRSISGRLISLMSGNSDTLSHGLGPEAKPAASIRLISSSEMRLTDRPNAPLLTDPSAFNKEASYEPSSRLKERELSNLARQPRWRPARLPTRAFSALSPQNQKGTQRSKHAVFLRRHYQQCERQSEHSIQIIWKRRYFSPDDVSSVRLRWHGAICSH